MLVEEARKKLDALDLEDVKEAARQELLRRDAATLVDALLVVLDREQLTEWAVPIVLEVETDAQREDRVRKSTEAARRLADVQKAVKVLSFQLTQKIAEMGRLQDDISKLTSTIEGRLPPYGKLNEAAVLRLLPEGELVGNLLRVSLLETVDLSHSLFDQHRVRLVPEGMEGDSFLMGVYAPIVEEAERPTDPTAPEHKLKTAEEKRQEEEERKQREAQAERELATAAKPTVNMPDPAHTSNFQAPTPMTPADRGK